jgi:hypothetical protein
MRLARFAVLILTSLAFLAVPSSAFGAERLQWSITPKANLGGPDAGPTYSLNNDTGGGLSYGRRVFGIDLVWSGGSQWQFRRTNPRDHRQIQPTETVALYNTRVRRYLNYGSQRFGINLVWSSTPRYQWRVAEGQIQTPGPTQGNVRSYLYNAAAGAYLIYQRRSVGINLGWQR